MKYLCLAYGDENDWHALTKREQDALLAQDEVHSAVPPWQKEKVIKSEHEKT